MSTGWKIGLTIIAAFLLVMMLGAGACFYYFSELGNQVKEDQRAAERLGETADEQACLHEAMARAEGKNAISGTASATVFLATCLQKSRPSRGFCDGVPEQDDREGVRLWVESKCKEQGQTASITCSAMMSAVISHCRNRGSDPAPSPTAKPEELKNKEKKK